MTDDVYTAEIANVIRWLQGYPGDRQQQASQLWTDIKSAYDEYGVDFAGLTLTDLVVDLIENMASENTKRTMADMDAQETIAELTEKLARAEAEAADAQRKLDDANAHISAMNPGRF